MRLIAISALVILSSSCVTLSKEQCQTMDWFEKGKADGMAGLSASHAADYQARCSKFGYNIDLENYSKGRAKGLNYFCTLENGERFGKKNGYYFGVCPTGLEENFLKGYHFGKKYAELKRREQELAELESRLRRDQCHFDSDCGENGHCGYGPKISHGRRCKR